MNEHVNNEAIIVNIPNYLTSFIGREQAIAEIIALLRQEETRLITLLGLGGMGKTRLAVECVRRLTQNDFEHGIFYVSLAPLATASNIVSTIISVLGIVIEDEGTSKDKLIEFLNGRNMLIVLDNFEHIVDGAHIVADILMRTADVKILVTSRESLNLSMEWVYAVQGMHVPDRNVEDVMDYSSVQLFMNRAKQVRHDFDVDKQLEQVIAICKQVDGMPLAIELVSSWLKVLSMDEIHNQIQSGMDLLETRNRNVQKRHRSIHAVFDSSWNLLTSEEKQVLSCLCVFQGSFTLQAVQAVTGTDMQTLAGLVEKSMVRRDQNGRYDLHELVRQYAGEKLVLSGQQEKSLLTYLAYFSDFMAERTLDIKGRRQIDGLKEIGLDFDNVVVAWHQACLQKKLDVLDNMMEGLALFCIMRALYSQGVQLFEQALETLAFSHENNITIVTNRLWLCYMRVSLIIIDSADHVSAEIPNLESSLKFAQAHDDRMAEAMAWMIWGELLLIDRKRQSSLEYFDRALTIYKSMGDLYYVAYNTGRLLFQRNWLGTSSRNQRDDAIRLFRQIGDTHGLSHCLASVLFYYSPEEAQETIREVRRLAQAHDDIKLLAFNYWFNGRDLWLNGQFDAAERELSQSLKLFSRIGYQADLERRDYGSLSMFRGNYAIGQQLLENSFVGKPPPHLPKRNKIAGCLAMMLLPWSDRQRYHTSITKALQFTLADPYVDEAGATFLAIYALLQKDEGDFRQATLYLSQAFTCADDYLMRWMITWEKITDCKTFLQNQLGLDRFNSLWHQGQSQDLRNTLQSLNIKLSPDDNVQLSLPSHVETLTERELEVLEHLAVDDYEYADIAEQLFISTGTVRTHAHHIYQKLGVKNRRQAVLVGQQYGLL